MSNRVTKKKMDKMTRDIQKVLEYCETPEVTVDIANILFICAQNENEKPGVDPIQKATIHAVLNIINDCMAEKIPEVAGPLAKWVISACNNESPYMIEEEKTVGALSLSIAYQWLKQDGDYITARNTACDATGNYASSNQREKVHNFINTIDDGDKRSFRQNAVLKKMQQYGEGFFLQKNLEKIDLWVVAPIVF